MMFRAPSQLSSTMEVNRTLEYLASWAMESIRSRASGHRVHFVVQKSGRLLYYVYSLKDMVMNVVEDNNVSLG